MIKLLYPEFWSRNGLLPLLLTPFSWLYQLLTILRNIFTKPIKLNAKVICIGNISVGGTGKTQIVELLAKHYKQQNKNILIITKGYGSSLKTAKLVNKTDSASDVGDESILLREIAPVIAARKIQYALPLIEELEPEIIIFDDGLQNPNFIKDCKIIVIDNERAIGNGRIFPSGPLREAPHSAFNHCDAVIMIGDRECTDLYLIKNINKQNKPIFKASIKLASKVNHNTEYFAFSAIGNPNKFFNTLINNGANIKETKHFPDHHQFSKQEMCELKNIAKKHNYTLITTKKDYVKIKETKDIECALVNLVFEDKPKFINLIDETLS